MSRRMRLKARAVGVVFIAGCASALPACTSLPTRPSPGSPSVGEGRFLASLLPVAHRTYRGGPAALESVFRYWGRPADAAEIGQDLLGRGERGVLHFALASQAREAGFWAEMRRDTLEDLKRWVGAGFPPIVLLATGPGGAAYHFAAVRGFDEHGGLLYVNTGRPQTQAIAAAAFDKSWGAGGRWLLLICPLQLVGWELSPVQAAELASLLERSGRFEQAVERCEQALQAMPESQPVRFSLANLYLRLGRREEAKTLYRSLLAEDPSAIPYSHRLAWTCLLEGRYEESIRVGEEALRRSPQRRHDLLDTVGLAYCRMKEYGKGQAYLVEALEKAPTEDAGAIRAIRSHLEECVP